MQNADDLAGLDVHYVASHHSGHDLDDRNQTVPNQIGRTSESARVYR